LEQQRDGKQAIDAVHGAVLSNLAGHQRIAVILLNHLPADLWQDAARYQRLNLLQANRVQASDVYNQLL